MTKKSQNTNIKKQGAVYDPVERTFQFARDVRLFLKKLLSTLNNPEDGKQSIRFTGSSGVNYI